jgi:hypothetical protein
MNRLRQTRPDLVFPREHSKSDLERSVIARHTPPMVLAEDGPWTNDLAGRALINRKFEFDARQSLCSRPLCDHDLLLDKRQDKVVLSRVLFTIGNNNLAPQPRANRVRRAALVIVDSPAPARPPKQAAIAPRRRAIEPNRAPRDTALAATSAAWVAFCLALSTACRYCCSYCCI